MNQALLAVTATLLASAMAGCTNCLQAAGEDSGCWHASDYYYEQAAKEIGLNNTRRDYYRTIAKQYQQAAMDGADCKGWRDRKLVAPTEGSS